MVKQSLLALLITIAFWPSPALAQSTAQTACLFGSSQSPIIVCPPSAANPVGVFEIGTQTRTVQTSGVVPVNLAVASTTKVGDFACTSSTEGAIIDNGINACPVNQQLGFVNQTNLVAVSKVNVRLTITPIYGTTGTLVCISGSTLVSCPISGTQIVGAFKTGTSIAVVNTGGYANVNLATSSTTTLGDYACSNAISAGTIIDTGSASCPSGQQAGFVGATNPTPVSLVPVYLTSFPFNPIGSGVSSLNGMTGAINVVGGAGITVTPINPNITISYSPPLELGTAFDPNSTVFGINMGIVKTNPSCGAELACFDFETFGNYTQNTTVAGQEYIGIGDNDIITGSGTVTAINSFYAGAVYEGSGTVTTLSGLSDEPRVATGTVVQGLGIQMGPVIVGSGVMQNWTGLLFGAPVGTVSGPAYNIQALNTYPSFHQGPLWLGQTQGGTEFAVGGGGSDLVRLIGVQNPELRMMTTTANASNRSYAFDVNQMNNGDFDIYQSTTDANDPIASGASIFHSDKNGNIGIGNPPTVPFQLNVNKSIASGLNVVAYSATPVFDASLGNTQEITLTGNVTSSTLGTAPAVGEVIQLNFIICQDGAGSHTFVWPTQIHGAVSIGGTASKCSEQSFIFDGTTGYAVGVTNQ
jgi:hypothetical protein